MVRLKKADGKNVWDILKLEIKDSQRGFVAKNETSIIQAWIADHANGTALPFGIYDDELLVGFLMIGFDKDDYWVDAPAIASNNYNLWRFMIGKEFQNRGYGKQAVEKALAYIRTFPCGKAKYCWLSYEPENAAARHICASFGFKETGDKGGEEIIAVLEL